MVFVSYYEKRPDLIMDFYFVICDHLLYDKNSWNKYKNEIVLMDKLWEATNGGNNYNFSILYIHVAQYTLRTEFSYTEGIKNSKAFNFVTNKYILVLVNYVFLKDSSYFQPLFLMVFHGHLLINIVHLLLLTVCLVI